MAKKIVMKRKIKLFNLLIILIVLFGLSFSVYYVFQIPLKGIVIKNTNYLNDDYIIDLAGIKNYPKYITLRCSEMEKKISKSEYVDSVKIKRKWPFILEIDANENKPLFYDMNKNKYVFASKESASFGDISKDFLVPRLLNYVPDVKYEKFINGMNNVKGDILVKISDIEYQPNDYDKDRFLLYMDDGNLVYLTLTKFKMINHYNDVFSQLEGHKGILYLDSGNHFKIME
jgi:cell division septal protein FtsQ